jgi:hypothetical protein
MPIQDVYTRITEINALVGRLGGAPPTPPAPPAPAQEFESTLAAAQQSSSTRALAWTTPVTGAVSGSAGARALAAAQAEVGVAEMPPGSNEAPRIADYRAAVAGSYPGAPWCAYFVSWAAAQAGAPIGTNGSGYGAVEQVEAWGRQTGRFLPAGTVPAPGDLILFGGAHIGIVESVNPDGSINTVEGNHNDRVDRARRSPGEATGFVRL